MTWLLRLAAAGCVATLGCARGTTTTPGAASAPPPPPPTSAKEIEMSHSDPASTPAAATNPSAADAALEAGWELVPRASYAARQQAGVVTVRATGSHSTAGVQTKLVQ